MVITTMQGYTISKHSWREQCENCERECLPLLLVLLMRLFRRNLRDLGPSEDDIAAEIATSGFGAEILAWLSISKELPPPVSTAAVPDPWSSVSPVAALLLGEEDLVAVELLESSVGGAGAAGEGDEAIGWESNVRSVGVLFCSPIILFEFEFEFEFEFFLMNPFLVDPALLFPEMELLRGTYRIPLRIYSTRWDASFDMQQPLEGTIVDCMKYY